MGVAVSRVISEATRTLRSNISWLLGKRGVGLDIESAMEPFGTYAPLSNSHIVLSHLANEARIAWASLPEPPAGQSREDIITGLLRSEGYSFNPREINWPGATNMTIVSLWTLVHRLSRHVMLQAPIRPLIRGRSAKGYATSLGMSYQYEPPGRDHGSDIPELREILNTDIEGTIVHLRSGYVEPTFEGAVLRLNLESSRDHRGRH